MFKNFPESLIQKTEPLLLHEKLIVKLRISKLSLGNPFKVCYRKDSKVKIIELQIVALFIGQNVYVCFLGFFLTF